MDATLTKLRVWPAWPPRHSRGADSSIKTLAPASAAAPQIFASPVHAGCYWEAFDRCKALVKEAGLSGPGQVRVNKAGCLDRCAAGPVAVVYPEAVWYSYVDASDIDEIVESHLKNGQVVQRLLTPAHLGR